LVNSTRKAINDDGNIIESEECTLDHEDRKFSVLLMIYYTDNCTLTDIREVTSIPDRSISYVIASLKKVGVIIKRSNPGRNGHYTIADSGCYDIFKVTRLLLKKNPELMGKIKSTSIKKAVCETYDMNRTEQLSTK
jgi:DNA-binding transcriptional regulator GbsR (MarR family)